jgi:molybdopterin-guanine dinucleotide biosynthesis adapter protein
MPRREQPVFGVTGWKNAGKTTMVERLVTEFSRRGMTVSTVKHAHHNFDIDITGSDSWRHRAAGAHETMLVSGFRWAIMHELRGDDEPSLEEMLGRLSPCDLALVEGYKRAAFDKIEMLPRDGLPREPIWKTHGGVVAVAGERIPEDCRLPAFHPDAIGEIADFIGDHLCLSRQGKFSDEN